MTTDAGFLANVHSAPALMPYWPPEWADVFGEDDSGIFAECEVQGIGFVWRWIGPGKFRMGCDPKDEHGFGVEKPQQEVVITRGFWMGETPVTQEQWEAVTGQNPSHFKGPRRPVEQVSWHDSVAFMQKLNQLLPGLHAALPTEAQWEYACRAGTQAAFHDGSPCTVPEGKDPALDRLGWFGANSDGQTHDVKLKNANAWGLYDLHGNVWEWCRDAWDAEAYAKRPEGAPAPETTSDDKSAYRVVRGGAWVNRARVCRAAFRSRLHPGFRVRDLGLRLSAGQELRAAEPPGAERPLPERRSRARRAEGSEPA